MKKLSCIFLLVLLCSCTSKNNSYSAEYFDLFDTVCQITAVAKDEKQFADICDYTIKTTTVYHRLFDAYGEYEDVVNIATLNKTAAVAPVVVSEDLFDFLIFCKEQYKVTTGKVNIAMGSVLQLWHKARTFSIQNPEKAYLPDDKDLLVAAQHIDIEKLVLNPDNYTVYFEDDLLQLDVGAVAKGYAAGAVATKLRANGYENILLSFGGNVVAVGSKDGESWIVGIQNPDENSPEALIQKVDLSGGYSVVTSGDYRRYFTVNGKQYNHIIDPNTLQPANYYSAVIIICKDSGVADTLSTAVFLMPIKKAKALIESIADTEALFVFLDFRCEPTSGFYKYLGDK